MIATFRPDITEALATADRLVAPWLDPGDTWRKAADGLPEIDDMVVVLGRLRGQDHFEFRTVYRSYEYHVNECDSRDQWSGETLPEALLLMLAADLKRTCAECKQYDGHDVRCSVLAAELAEEAAAR